MDKFYNDNDIRYLSHPTNTPNYYNLNEYIPITFLFNNPDFLPCIFRKKIYSNDSFIKELMLSKYLDVNNLYEIPPKIINLFKHINPISNQLKYINRGHYTYDECIKDLTTLKLGYSASFLKLRTQNFLIGFNTIFEYYRGGILKPLAVLMIKRKNISYILLKIILNEFPDPNTLELWIQKGFDHKDYPHKGVRKHYRAIVKNPLLEKGVKLIEKDNLLSDLALKLELPKFNTLKDVEQFNECIKLEFLQEYGK